MAYMDQKIKSEIAAQVAPLLKKHGLKGTFRIERGTGSLPTLIRLVVRSGPVDFGPKDFSFSDNGMTRENKWGSDEMKLNVLAILDDLGNAMRLPSYFDTAYNYAVTVGSWDKSYILTE